MDWNKPSPIQATAVPRMLANPPSNLIGQSHNGTGKTGTFTMAILSRVDVALSACQGLCVCPTRELAKQTMQVVIKMSQFMVGFKWYEALPAESKKSKEPVRAHVVVGTPGRIKDLVNQRPPQLDCSKVRVFVLDEADNMLDAQGLKEQSMGIKRKMPPSCQILLFSATFDEEVERFAQECAPRAQQIIVKREELTLPTIQQFYADCLPYQPLSTPIKDTARFRLLCDLYTMLTLSQSIIFCVQIKTAQDVAAAMVQAGHSVSLIHGTKMPVGERDRVMDEFRNGTTKVLVSTDVLARGTDVPAVSLVVNYDLPVAFSTGPSKVSPDTYIHRVGRAGRFGRRGVAISFVSSPQSKTWLDQIQAYFGSVIKKFDQTEAAFANLSAILSGDRY